MRSCLGSSGKAGSSGGIKGDAHLGTGKPTLHLLLFSPLFSPILLVSPTPRQPWALSWCTQLTLREIKTFHSLHNKAGWSHRVPSQLQPSEIKAGVSLAVVTDFAWILVPRPKRATASVLGTESPRFLDRPDFFDYPDSDQARLLAVAQFIGEKPIMFVNSGMNQLEKGPPSPPGPGGEQPPTLPLGHQRGIKGPACLAGSSPGLFHHILVGFLVVVVFFLLFQFCTHM